MHKKFFNFRLFKEGFKQLKLFGIISLILYLLSVVLLFINQTGGRNIVTIYNCNPLVLLSYTVIAPLFTLFLFNFLTSRNSSDFYHSVPYTRPCIFISFFTSIVAWIALIHFSSTILSVVMRLCMPDTFSIQWTSIIKTSFGIFICSIAVVCGVLFSQSITGTIFTNILVTGLILFLPRLFTTIFISMINNRTFGIISTNYFSTFLTGSKNMVVYPIMSLFLDSGFKTAFESYGEWFYTLILAIVYFALALTFFKKRQSEVAGNAAVSNTLQAIYRIAVTMFVCMIPITILCDKETAFSASDLPMYITMYVIAIATYFLYEIITTRTVKRLLKITPGLIIVFVLNVVAVFGVSAISDYELSNIPKKEDIESVTVLSSEDSDLSYIDSLMSGLQIKDKKIISSTINHFEDYINSSKKVKHSYYTDDSNIYSVKFTAKNGATLYRNIPLNSSTVKKIYTYASKDSTFLKSLESLPDYSDVTVHISCNFPANYTVKENKDIYTSFYNEYKKLSTKQKLYLQLNDYVSLADISDDYNNMSAICYLNIYTQDSSLYIPVFDEFFPETAQKCIKLFMGSKKEIKDNKKNINSLKNSTLLSDGDSFTISMWTNNNDGNDIYYSAEKYDNSVSVSLSSNSVNTDSSVNANNYKFPSEFIKKITSLAPDSYEELSQSDKTGLISITFDNSVDSYTLYMAPTDKVMECINNFTKSVSDNF